MKTIFAFLALFSVSQARELTFEWDKPASPVDGYVIYVKQGDGNWVNTAEPASNTFTGLFPDGDFSIAVSAFRKIGGSTDRLQSERSDALAIPQIVPTPSGLRIVITLQIKQ